ncbi:helix-turn-helix domain-containing protein [Pseudomonas sp.]|uniref:helix-turn-helix domain-containing protein n=1 Tax=Pseudomonas sp. TaxID=306 RepID=UPI002732A974|nr:helix-turn-helix transcriptional regulator [Pseudomonas sp.]MDP3814242.1 helix-turn-helix transcriptional regulator [Pseudomonas sp.]
MHIGQVIYALRREKGLTQEALALEAETATSNLSRIEKGQRRPSGALLERLADALGTSVTAIYAGAEGVPLNTAEPARLAEVDTADFSREAVQLRQDFRDLSLSNKRLTLEFVRMLARLQKGGE